MLTGEAEVIGRVPVLGQDHGMKLSHEGVDPWHDLIPAGDGKCAAGAEVVLNIDDKKGFGRVTHGSIRMKVRVRLPYGLSGRAQPCRPHAMLIVAALYKFTRFDDPEALIEPLRDLCEMQGVKGSLLVASEGINGTIAGTRDGIDAVLAHIVTLPGCADLEWKESPATDMPFGRMKVRLKKEIVTMGVPGTDPNAIVGTYVAPEDWNALIAAPDVALIDTRNDYETAIGTFEGAVDPGTDSFRDFPAWWEKNQSRFEGKRIAMFCTGGIRCEKSTAYLKSQGVEDVYHLKGGILKYLEDVPPGESLWQGGCFVFDERVAVGHGLSELPYSLCRACRRPIAAEEQQHPDFEEGVSCPQCIGQYSDADRARFRERQRQVKLAEARGAAHLGR